MIIRSFHIALIASFLLIASACSGNNNSGKLLTEDIQRQASMALDSVFAADSLNHLHSVEFLQMDMPMALSEEMQESYKSSMDVLSAYVLTLAFSKDNLKDEKKKKEVEDAIKGVIDPFRGKAAEVEKKGGDEHIFALAQVASNNDTVCVFLI